MRLRPVQFPYRPYLDTSPADRRNFRRHPERLVEILGLDKVKPTELFLSFCEGPVCRDDLAIAAPDSFCTQCRPQALRGAVVAGFPNFFPKSRHISQATFHLALGQGLARF